MTILRYKGDTTTDGLSGFWASCPLLHTVQDPGIGYGFIDDFLKWGINAETLTTVVDLQRNGEICFGSSGATITPDEAVGGGVVLTEATADDSIALSFEQHPFNITQDGGELWFEARVKTSTITASEQNFFVGLMDTTALAVAVPMAVGGALADINCVGFLRPELDTTTMDCVYRADGVTAVEVNAEVGTLAADTYIKLGMHYDPSDSYKLSYYVDGAQQATKKVIPDAVGTDFPADVRLAPVIAQMLGNTAAETLTMDWWACYQRRV